MCSWSLELYRTLSYIGAHLCMLLASTQLYNTLSYIGAHLCMLLANTLYSCNWHDLSLEQTSQTSAARLLVNFALLVLYTHNTVMLRNYSRKKQLTKNPFFRTAITVHKVPSFYFCWIKKDQTTRLKQNIIPIISV